MTVSVEHLAHLRAESEPDFKRRLSRIFKMLWRDPYLMAALDAQAEVEELLMSGAIGSAALVNDMSEAARQTTEAAQLHVRAWLSLARTGVCPECLAGILQLENGVVIDWPITGGHDCIMGEGKAQQPQQRRKSTDPLPLT